MNDTSKYFEVVKSVMPTDAKYIRNEQSDDYALSISWDLNTDPERPNKQSKVIALVISKEATEDFGELPSSMKENALERLRSILNSKLSSFEPDHNTPYNMPGPVEKWVISSSELLG